MDWTLPANLSANTGSVDDLYYLILAITGLAFLLVEAGILWFVFKYRSREGHTATYTHGDDRLEILWTAVPALVLIFLGIHSGQLWADLKVDERMPGDAFVVDVAAQQFEWHFTYPGADGELGTSDDFTDRNRLHVPADRPVKVRLTSEDVIHSFFIPELRVKQDAVPGRVTTAWFEVTESGELEMGCAELCGLGHYRMSARVTVQEGAEFDDWHAGRSAEAAGAAGDDG